MDTASRSRLSGTRASRERRDSHSSMSPLPSRLWGWGGVGAITSMATPPESPHAALMRDTSLQYEDAIIPELDIYAIPSKEGTCPNVSLQGLDSPARIANANISSSSDTRFEATMLHVMTLLNIKIEKNRTWGMLYVKKKQK